MRTPNLIVVAVLAVAASVLASASASASYAVTDTSPTCQGQTATVVGPTETEGMSTIGTEGDDVIVAPIFPADLGCGGVPVPSLESPGR